MSKLTRAEVESWPLLGPMGLKAERVLSLIDERDALVAKLDEAQARIAMLHEALAVSRFELPLLCMASSSETLHERERAMTRRFNDAIAATAEQVAAWRASIESAARADERAKASDAVQTAVHDAIYDVCANEERAISKGSAPYTVTFRRVVLLNEAMAAAERALAAEPAPSETSVADRRNCDTCGELRWCLLDADNGITWSCDECRVTAPAEDPHSPAFNRVGQTGVERALPVADAQAATPHAWKKDGAGPSTCVRCGMKWIDSYDAHHPPCTSPAAKPEACATYCAKVASGEREAPCMYACERDTGRAR